MPLLPYFAVASFLLMVVSLAVHDRLLYEVGMGLLLGIVLLTTARLCGWLPGRRRR